MAQTSSGAKTPAWIFPVTLVSLLLGFLVVTAIRAEPSKESPFYGMGRYDSRSSVPNIGTGIDEKNAEIAKLRDEITKLQTSLATQNRQGQVLNDSLQEGKLLAGLSKVQGPGVIVTLRDSSKRTEDPLLQQQLNIHDLDVMRVVNELKASGAEAISVNNQRVTGQTFFRCEGPVIYVGRTPIASPIVIQAIGDPDTLYGAIMMQGRFLDEIRSTDPTMVEVKKTQKLVLPAYTGSTQFDHAKVAAVEK